MQKIAEDTYELLLTKIILNSDTNNNVSSVGYGCKNIFSKML